MALAVAISELFDGLTKRDAGDQFDADPAEQYDYTGEVFKFVDPADQQKAEDAYKARTAARVVKSVRAELEAKISAAAEARLRDEAEAKVKAELAAESEKV